MLDHSPKDASEGPLLLRRNLWVNIVEVQNGCHMMKDGLNVHAHSGKIMSLLISSDEAQKYRMPSLKLDCPLNTSVATCCQNSN